MSSGWSCFICGTPNDLASRSCTKCGAARPAVADSLAGAEPEIKATQAAQPVEVPGSMLTGLAALIRQAAEGTLTPAAFSEKIADISTKISPIFDDMAQQITSQAQGDNGDYADAVKQTLDDSCSLFKIALAELYKFGKDASLARLRYGMLIAEKAEDTYLQLLRAMQQDAEGSSLQGQADVVRTLAYGVVSGEITLDEYKTAITKVDKAVNHWLEEGSATLKAGLQAALAFDGRGAGSLDMAGQMLNKASEQLAHVILAVHTREAGEQAADQFVAQ